MKPDDPSARVIHETIYAQPRGGLKAAMIDALRQAKPARGRRRTTLAGSPLPEAKLQTVNSAKKRCASQFCGICHVNTVFPTRSISTMHIVSTAFVTATNQVPKTPVCGHTLPPYQQRLSLCRDRLNLLGGVWRTSVESSLDMRFLARVRPARD